MCHVTHDIRLFLDLHTLRFYLNVNFWACSWLENQCHLLLKATYVSRATLRRGIDRPSAGCLVKALKLFQDHQVLSYVPTQYMQYFATV